MSQILEEKCAAIQPVTRPPVATVPPVHHGKQPERGHESSHPKPYGKGRCCQKSSKRLQGNFAQDLGAHCSGKPDDPCGPVTLLMQLLRHAERRWEPHGRLRTPSRAVGQRLRLCAASKWYRYSPAFRMEFIAEFFQLAPADQWLSG